MAERQPIRVAVVCSFILALVLLEMTRFIPHFAESATQMRKYIHTPLGAAILFGGVALLALVLNFVFVELWARREAHRRNRRNKGAC
jgi:hypothetical protein